jgi:hypothetical protein
LPGTIDYLLPIPGPQHKIIRLYLPLPSSTKFRVYLKSVKELIVGNATASTSNALAISALKLQNRHVIKNAF